MDVTDSNQAEHYPEFAVNNTYGIKAYNDTVYNYARFATFMRNGWYVKVKAEMSRAPAGSLSV